MHDPDPKKEKGPIELIVDALAGFVKVPVSDESNEVPDRDVTAQVAKAEGLAVPETKKRRKPASRKRAAVSKKRAAPSKKKRVAASKKRTATSKKGKKPAAKRRTAKKRPASKKRRTRR